MASDTAPPRTTEPESSRTPSNTRPTYEELLARVAQLEQQLASLPERIRKNEDALRQREERHRLALAAGAMATWDWHVLSGEVVWNDEHFRMLGYEPGSIAPSYQAWADRVHPDDRAATEKLVQANVEQGGEYRSEFRALLADGTVRWIEARGRTERAASGQPLRQYGVMLDITERKRTEEVLRRYELLAGESRDIVLFMRSEDGCILEANAAAQSAYGYSREELLSLSIRDLRALDTTSLTNEQMAIADARGILFETVHRRKDGSTFPVEVSSRGSTIEGTRTLISIVRDITERKRTEESLRASETTLRSILDNLQDAYFRADLSGRFLVVSASAVQMYGYDSVEEMVGLPAETLYANPQERTAVLDATHRSGRINDCVVLSRRRDGTTFWVSMSVQSWRDATGQIAGSEGVVRDITERKQAEEALRESESKYREANARLAEADRRKDEFIAILSHELRNPLAPIRYALPLLGEERLGDAGRRATAVIDRQVRHLARLVDDLLDVSRITTGKVELRTDYITLDAVLRTAVEGASPAIVAAQHRLDIAVPDAPIWLRADPARIAQAVTNLLNNSAKYTPKGGRIRLEATASEAQAIIRVVDNGVGIAPEALPTVFEMFRQVSGPNRSQGGLGIGLTLTRQFVEMHGGTLEACSAGENKGAEFVIRLPLAPAPGRPDETPAPKPSGRATCLRVLVVDDNVDLVEMLALMVDASGHQVRKASDGVSAVSAALEYHPHVVLLDLGMPGMDGIEVAKELRRHPEMSSTRIVALTGWGQAEDRRQTSEAGFDDHLTKPTDPEELERLLAEFASELPS